MSDWFNEYYKKPTEFKNDNLWEEYKKDIERLKTNKISSPKSSPKPKKHTPYIDYSFSSLLPEKVLQPFDRNIKRKISRERIEIEATLDLHGFTIREAEEKIVEFILNCYNTRKSYVLIITGKGSIAPERKTLRNELPAMLKDVRISPIVISYTFAGKKHGDIGAYYLHLRRAPNSRSNTKFHF